MTFVTNQIAFVMRCGVFVHPKVSDDSVRVDQL